MFGFLVVSLANPVAIEDCISSVLFSVYYAGTTWGH